MWVDAWVPRQDPLWDDDVGRSAEWVGRWWAAALALPASSVHHGPPLHSAWSRAVCFAGIAPGEVAVSNRKVVGVAQWRGREGALSQSLAYLAVDWAEVAALLQLGPERHQAVSALGRATVTLRDLGLDDADEVVRRLTAALPGPGSWARLDPIP